MKMCVTSLRFGKRPYVIKAIKPINVTHSYILIIVLMMTSSIQYKIIVKRAVIYKILQEIDIRIQYTYENRDES